MGPLEVIIVSNGDSSSVRIDVNVDIDVDVFTDKLVDVDPLIVDAWLVPNLLEREMKPTSLAGTGTVIRREAGEEIESKVGRIGGTVVVRDSEIELHSASCSEVDTGDESSTFSI